MSKGPTSDSSSSPFRSERPSHLVLDLGEDVGILDGGRDLTRRLRQRFPLNMRGDSERSYLVGLPVDQAAQRGAGDLAGARLGQRPDEQHFPERGHGSDRVPHQLHDLAGGLGAPPHAYDSSRR